MYTIRPSDARGKADHGWLKSRFTFSFADYRDPAHMGYTNLRVLNDDWIAPGQGFGMHPHRDMEIFSFVDVGQLQHRDSQGNERVIHPGRVQLMGAGSGIQHSEFNPSADERTHLYQIWVLPRARGLEPSYAELDYDLADPHNTLKRLADPHGTDGALPIRQHICIYTSDLDAGEALDLPLAGSAWLQLMRGSISIGGQTLSAGDGLAIQDEPDVRAEATEDAAFLYFDMAAKP